jgi:hypothetical protein
VADAGVGLGDVGGRLLVVRVQVLDAVVAQVGDERDVRTVDDAAHELHPLGLEALRHQLAHGHHRLVIGHGRRMTYAGPKGQG